METLKIISCVGFVVVNASCASASISSQSSTVVTRSEVGQELPLNIRAELSSKESIAGTVALVTIHLNQEIAQTSPSVSSPIFQGDFEGVPLPFFPREDLGRGHYSALLPVPYQRKPGPGVVKVRLQENRFSEIPIQVIEGDYSSETLHVDGRRVNPTLKKDLIRIRKEQAEVGRIYRDVTFQKFWNGPFLMPIESPITSPFGTKRIYNGQLKNFHPGVDLKAPMNTPVLAPAPGKVVMAKDLFYTGNTVMINHGFGIITLYAHMNELKVKKGQMVSAKDLIGLSGQTGRVSGPHLHWQAVINRVKVNPIGLTQVVR